MRGPEETDDPHQIIRAMRKEMIWEARGDERAARFLKWVTGGMVAAMAIALLFVWFFGS